MFINKNQRLVTRGDISEKELKFMTVPFEIKEIEEDDKYFHFKGYASTFGNVDRGGDVVLKGAFVDSLNEMNRAGDVLPALWQHNSNEPVGIYKEVYEDNVGLFVHGIMPKDDDFVKGRVIPQMEIGSITKMSIGYSVVKYTSERTEDDDLIWHLHKLKLWEVSVVTIPMNNNANITEMKTIAFEDLPVAGKDVEWDAVEAEKRIKEWSGGKEGLPVDEMRKKYKSAFLWHDQKDIESFGAYKLLFADVIDGNLTAIPKGIFAAAASVASSKGVDIPDAEKENVINIINKYYKKMDLESPFESKTCFRIDDIKCFDECLLENLLKTGVKVSNKTAKTIVSFIKAGFQRDADKIAQRDVERKDFNDVIAKINNITEDIKNARRF